MLTRLLQLIEAADGHIDLLVLSRQLGAEPSAVAGMLETLRRKGRLAVSATACGSASGSADGVCERCSLSRHCQLPARPATRYRIG